MVACCSMRQIANLEAPLDSESKSQMSRPAIRDIKMALVHMQSENMTQKRKRKRNLCFGAMRAASLLYSMPISTI